MDTTYCQVFEKPIDESVVPTYTTEEHGTWKLLIETQSKLIPGRAADEFIQGVKNVAFPEDRIPALKDISHRISKFTGWSLVRVEGLVHPKDFFALLAKKTFPSTDFIRKREELKYTSAPDMFHDLFGHTPLLTIHDFTDFFEYFGKVGVKAYQKYPEDHEIHKMLPRIYWFAVEFGLVQGPSGVRAYGSGSTSSPEELEFCMGPKCRKHSFDLNVITHRDYDIWKLQEDVFVVPSFIELGRAFREWTKAQQLA